MRFLCMRGGALVAFVLALLCDANHGFELKVELQEEKRLEQFEEAKFDSRLELATNEEHATAQREFDYFVFSQQWPGTYCKQSGSCCQNVEQPVKFTIHGVWPDYSDGSYPSCCRGPAYEQKKVDDLLDLLEEYWPTLSCSSPKQCSGRKTGSFWQHEWEKHGTCAYPIIPDEATYFTVGLNLRLKYDISKILSDAGFVPDSGKQYQTSKMVAAVRAAVGATPVFSCRSKQINEIWICFDKDLKIRNCGSSSNSCPKKIRIPPFQY